MRIPLIASMVLAAMLCGCVQDGATPSQWADAAPVGPAVNCIESSRIRETQVRSDTIVDFRTRDGVTYRNTLPIACSMLTISRSFTYRTDGGQLCSIDTVQVRPTGGGIPGPTCGLGTFQPIDLPAG
ncbi:hypothetical protein [Sphingomonas japonica]|uniref:Lipoprotein n=1 Tax=Sphingomonas japonica TaxID=511662 RepID=A0ABX0TZG5_9SPHN|nr:hypothetical protein [Sphingomonas japonica]NIJ23623.1 hypothetical protein [Sphingomonas japonica]